MSKSTFVEHSEKKVLEYIKQGVEAIAIPVSKTLGPEAKTTLMYRTYNRGPRNVDDGFYTSEVIMPKNPFVRLVAEFFKEITMRTNRKVGDGTSATTVIGWKLFLTVYFKMINVVQGFSNKDTNKKVGVMALKREILSEAEKVKEQIRKVAKPIKDLKDLEKVSAISLGDDNELSKKIAKLAFDVGVDGFIDTVEGYKGEVEIEHTEGARFHAKVADKAFINKKEQFKMEVEDCPVFITNHKLDNEVLVQYMVNKFESGKLIMMAPDFSALVLSKMAASHATGVQLWPVKVASLRTEQLEDIAIFCGATLVDKNKGMKLENITGKELGKLQKLIVKDVEVKEDAIALGGAGEKTGAVKERIKVLKGQLEETREPQFKMLMQRRIASLAAAGGTIRVGSPTDAESLPLKLKVEDVVGACKAALKGGYVKGGGLCLKEIAEALPDGHILKDALLAPNKQIQINSGTEIKIGKDVIDPADAVYYAVEHATSGVASLITVGNLVVEEPEIENGEGEKAIAKAIEGYTMLIKREKGLMTDSEKMAESDAMGGLTQDEVMSLDNG